LFKRQDHGYYIHVNLSNHKKLLWAIAIWFAALQAFAPFIHGHLDTDRSNAPHGLHFHDDERDHAFSDQPGHFIHDSTHVAHTVVIATGIKKDMDNSLFVAALLFVVLAFASQVKSASPLHPLEPIFTPLFRRRPSSPRAPPRH
jgi:hypothetical protein